ncbi:MAG: glycosyltransferase family 4 protein [Candidatus Omnitrophica bacterium]|nr:glycosyltransferase family 4 protein [Candidatus Omnitrophota bacterium]
MKSLFIVNDFPPIVGGQSTYYYNLCRALPKYSFIVLAPKWGKYKEFDSKQNFTIIRKFYLTKIPFLEKALKIILPFFYALSIMSKNDINKIHCAHVLSTGVVGLLLKILFRKEYFLYTHSADIMCYQHIPLIRKLLIVILKNASKVMANSNYTHNKLLELKVEKENIIISHPLIDFSDYIKETNLSNIVQKYDLKGRKVILSVNRLIERKGNDMVIRAIPIIKRELANVVYLIVGTGHYLSTLKSLVNTYNLMGTVIFLESITSPEIIDLYKACNVFVMPSRVCEKKGDAEGFGIVFLEANACGIPVIGGRSGGIPDAVIDNKTGILVDPLSVDEIAKAIIKVLNDEHYAKQLGECGKTRVKEIFDWRNGAKEVSHLF